MRICNIAPVCKCLGITYTPTQYYTDSPISRKCIGACHSCEKFVQCANWNGHTGFVEPIENLSVCHMVYRTESDIKGQCYAYIAAREKNSKMCEEISGDELENITLNEWYSNVTINDCYRYFAEFTGESSICYKINLDFIRDECFKSVAVVLGDVSLCENIKEAEDKGLCYISTAEKLKDVSLCENIEELALKDSCYFNLAKTLKNPSICEKITYKSEWKEDCIEFAS